MIGPALKLTHKATKPRRKLDDLKFHRAVYDIFGDPLNPFIYCKKFHTKPQRHEANWMKPHLYLCAFVPLCEKESIPKPTKLS